LGPLVEVTEDDGTTARVICGNFWGQSGPVDGVLAAHCWIVYRGAPLAERRDPRGVFTEIWVIPS